MRAALVNLATSVVDHVHMVDGAHVADGYQVVPTETANRGDRYVDGAFVAPVAAVVPPSAVALLGHLRARRDAILAEPQAFILAPAPPAPEVRVLCDGTDRTMVDLGVVWRRGIVEGDRAIGWLGPDGSVTMIQGSQGVLLEGKVAAWRDAVRVVHAGAKAAITGGGIATLAAIDAIAWPSGA